MLAITLCLAIRHNLNIPNTDYIFFVLQNFLLEYLDLRFRSLLTLALYVTNDINIIKLKMLISQYGKLAKKGSYSIIDPYAGI